MKNLGQWRTVSLTAVLAACWLAPTVARAQVVVGQTDTFEDGTTQNWAVGIGPGGGGHPEPPTNITTGGPGGVDDNFLRLTAVGGQGPGSRLSTINLLAQWSGDYVAAGVTGIRMDVNNLGASELSLRLLFEDPVPGPPANVAISTDAVVVPSGTGWISVFFPIAPGSLTALQGTVEAALTNTTALRLYHSPTPVNPGPALTTVLGVDNITALGNASGAPEPASALLLGVVGLSFALRRRSRLR